MNTAKQAFERYIFIRNHKCDKNRKNVAIEKYYDDNEKKYIWFRVKGSFAFDRKPVKRGRCPFCKKRLVLIKGNILVQVFSNICRERKEEKEARSF